MVQKTKVPKLQKLRWDRTHDLQATTDAPMYPLFCHHATVTDEIDKAPGVFVFHFPPIGPCWELKGNGSSLRWMQDRSEDGLAEVELSTDTLATDSHTLLPPHSNTPAADEGSVRPESFHSARSDNQSDSGSC